MSFIKKYGKIIIAIIAVSIVLGIAYFVQPTPEVSENIVNEAVAPQTEDKEEIKEAEPEKEIKNQPENKGEAVAKEVKQEEKPSEEKSVEETDELTCLLSIRCDTAVKNNTDNAYSLPENGIIFPEQRVVFYEEESVFNLLLREMKKNKIHFEFTNVPMYNSAYVEGINNLYEFDFGELSGWMYKVNGEFPRYGSSRYILKSNDKIEWIYTCDLGKDVGGEESAMNGYKN